MPSTILSVINAYKKFIEDELEKDNYLLVKAPPMGQNGKINPTSVIPSVTTGCLPHANFSLDGADNEFFQAPYIMVGMDDYGADYDETSLQILIQACCYSSSSYVTDQTSELYDLNIPDNRAFEDCLNLLEWMKNKIMSQGLIAGTSVDRPIRVGSYNSKELTYPYSFGYLTFPVNTVTHDISRKNFNY